MLQTEPKKFSDLAKIKNISQQILTGDFISIKNLLGKEITILWYRIQDTKIEKATHDKCLYIQIMYRGEKRITWTSSKYLMLALTENNIPANQPFTTTIKEIDQRYEFN